MVNSFRATRWSLGAEVVCFVVVLDYDVCVAALSVLRAATTAAGTLALFPMAFFFFFFTSCLLTASVT